MPVSLPGRPKFLPLKQGPRARSAIGQTGILDFYRSPRFVKTTFVVNVGGTLNFAGAGPSQTPDQIAGLKLWLKADSLSLSDGDPVSTWADSSGNGNDATQGTAGLRPLYKTNIVGGKPVVRFDGTDDYLALTGLNLTDFTAFVVYQTSGNNVLLGNAGTNFQIFGIGNGANAYSFYDNLTFLSSDILSAPRTSWNQGCITRSGSTVSFFESGVSRNSGTSGLLVTLQAIGQVIGVAYTNGDIAEIIIYNSALSTSDRQSIENYVLVKYGFASAGGGVLTKLILKNITAALSFAGGLTRQVAKSITAALSFSGGLTKRANKSTGGTLSFSGALSTLVAVIKNLAGTLSFSGGLTKRANKSTGGTLSFAGAITRVVQKATSGVLNFTGTLTKRANKSTGGTLSFSGAVSTVVAVIKNLAGTLSFSGGLTKRANKSTGGTLSFSGAITRSIMKSLSGTLSFSGGLTKLVSKSVGGALSFIGSLITNAGAGFTVFAGQILGGTSTTTRTSGSTTITQSSGESRVEKTTE
jgi:hypothetical protein